MYEYSYRALYMKFVRDSWIELCNQECGTLLYFDKDANLPRNAAKADKDIAHMEVCNTIKQLKKIGRALNWYNSYTLDPYLIRVFTARKNLTEANNEVLDAIDELEKKMKDVRAENKQAKADWEVEKAAKLAVKKVTDSAKLREQEQKIQWLDLQSKAKENGQQTETRGVFTTADQLQSGASP